MNESLNILIQAKLDEAVSVNNINTMLKSVQKRLEPIRVSIKMDEQVESTLNKFVVAMDKVKQAEQEQERIIARNIDILQKLNGETERVETRINALGQREVITTTRRKEATKSIQEEADATQRLASEIVQLEDTMKRVSTKNPNTGEIVGQQITQGDRFNQQRFNVNSEGELVGNIKQIENIQQYQQALEKLAVTREKLFTNIEQMSQKGILPIADLQNLFHMVDGIDWSGGLNQEHLDRMAEAENLYKQLNQQQTQMGRDLKNVDKVKAEAQAVEKLNEQMRFEIALQQRLATAKIDNLYRKYDSSVVDNAGVDKIRQQIADMSNLPLDPTKIRNYSREVNAGLKEIEATVRSAGGHSATFWEQFGVAMQRIPIWVAGMTAFYQALHYVTNGLNFTNEFNKSMTQIAIVLNQSQDQVYEYSKAWQKTAFDMSVATSEFVKGAVEFYRQGLSNAQVIERLTVATQYARISNLSFDESAKILTATTNALGVSAQRASDVFSYLGDATATGADELGRAFQRAGGSVAELMKDNDTAFEKTSSWIAVISSKTREGSETIGNAVKSILARMASLKEKGFAEEDGTKVNQVAKALNEVGVQLMDSEGQFRDFGKVMDDLGKIWDTLDTRQQNYLATTVAGTYQQSRFLALMGGYKDSVNLYNQALTSAGTTQQKYNIYLDSTQAHLDKLKNVGEKTWMDAFNSEGMKNAIDALTGLVTVLDKVIQLFGLANPVIFTASSAWFGFSKRGQEMRDTIAGVATEIGTSFTGKLRSFGGFFTSSGRDMKEFNKLLVETAVSAEGAKVGLETTAVATKGAGVAAEGATVAFKGLRAILASLGVGLLVVGISTAISWLLEKIGTMNSEQQKLDENNKKTIDSYSQNSNKITELVGKYEQLSEAKKAQGGLNTVDEEKFVATQNELAHIMPSLVQSIDDKGNATLKSAEAIQLELENVQKLTEAYNKLQISKFGDNMKEKQSGIGDAQSKVDDAKQAQQRAKDSISYLEGSINPERDNSLTEKSLIEARKALEQATYDLASAEQNLSIKRGDANTLISDTIRQQVGLQGNYGVLSDVVTKYIDAQVKQHGANIKNVDDMKDIVKQTKALADAEQLMIKYKKDNPTAKDQQDPNNLKQLRQDIEALNAPVDGLSGLWDKYNLGVTQTVLTSKQMSSMTDELTKKFVDTYDGLQPLNQAIDKLASGHKLSYSEIKTLVGQYPELITKIKEENGQMVLTKDALELVRKSRIDEFNVTLKTAKDKVTATEESVRAQLKAYGVQLDAIETVAQAEQKASEARKKFLENDKTAINNSSLNDDLKWAMNADLQKIGDDLYQNTYDELSAIAESRQRLNALEKFSSSMGNFDTTSDNPAKGSQKNPVDPYQSDEYQRSLEKLQQQLKVSDVEMKRYSETSKEYSAELNKQIDIYHQMQSLTANEADRLRGEDNALRAKLGTVGNDIEARNKILQQLDQNESKINRLSTAWWDYQASIESVTQKLKELAEAHQKALADTYNSWLTKAQTVADAVVNAIKASYEKQKKIHQDALDAQMQAEEIRHKTEMDNLDAEMKKFDDVIKAKLKALDNQISQDQYDKQMTEAQQAKNKTQQQIDLYSMDDSWESKAKLKDLREQLAKDNQKIADLEYNRDKELRKRNLNDQLEAYKQDNDGKKKSEDSQYEATKKSIDEQKKYWDWYYTELENDEREFTRIREQILAGNIDAIRDKLQGFIGDFDTFVQQNMHKTGSYVQDILNQIDALTKAIKDVGSIGDPLKSGTPTKVDDIQKEYIKNTQRWFGADDATRGQLEKQNSQWRQQYGFKEYSPDEVRSLFPTLADEVKQEAFSEYLKNKLRWEKTSDPAEKARLEQSNSRMRDWFNFIDYSKADILAQFPQLARTMGFDTGGYTGEWNTNGGKLAFLHQKEIVLNEGDTSNVLKIVDLAKNIISGMTALNVPKLASDKTSKQPSKVEVNMHIDKLMGDKKGAETVLSTVADGLRKLGVNI